MIRAVAVARRRGHRLERAAEHLHGAPLRNEHAAEKPEQRALAASARAVKEDALPGRDREARDCEARACLTVPRELEIADLDDRRYRAFAHHVRRGLRAVNFAAVC